MIDEEVGIASERPLEQILLEISEINKEQGRLSDQLEPLWDKMGELSPESREIVENYMDRLESEDIPDDEIAECPPEVREELNIARHVAPIYRQLRDDQKKLEIEGLPMMKKETEKAVESLLSRVNYDELFDYYKRIDVGQQDRSDSADILSNTVTELYVIRKIYHELQLPTEDRDFSHYEHQRKIVDEYKAIWEGKGLLSSTPLRVVEKNWDGTAIRERRLSIAEKSKSTLEQLREFGELVSIYRPGLMNNREHVDYLLDEVNMLMVYENNDGQRKYPLYYATDFQVIDFDPELLNAAERYIDKQISEHRKSGRISRTKEEKKEEMERIQAIDRSKVLSDLELQGFEVPPGRIPVVNIEDLISQAREILPPDFSQKLKILKSEETMPTETDENLVTIKKAGEFWPEYEEGKYWDKIKHTVIAIYRESAADSNISPEELTVARNEFVNTFWHEFGHNAHYTLDYDEIVEWEEVMKKDRVDITWNVKYRREKNENVGKREDFADSFKYFITDPALLYSLSSERYYYMLNYFQTHLQLEQAKNFINHLNAKLTIGFEVWSNLGYTADDIRRIYLQ